MDFSKKNNFVVRHNGAQYFHKDLETFKKHFPNHPLNSQLAKANQFSFARLDSQMLFIMIGTLSSETILSGREDKKDGTIKDALQSRIDDVKAMIAQAGLNIEDFSDEELTELSSGTDEEIKDLLDSIRMEQNVDLNSKSETENQDAETSEEEKETSEEEIPTAEEESLEAETDITSSETEISNIETQKQESITEKEDSVSQEASVKADPVTPKSENDKKKAPSQKKSKPGKKGSNKKNSRK